MNASKVAVCLILASLIFPFAGNAQLAVPEHNVFYFNDGPHSTWQWADNNPQLGQFWEWMYPTAIEPSDTVCASADVLQPQQEYYATSEVYAGGTFWCHFQVVLYLSNNYPDHSNPVHAAVGYGTPGNPAFFVQVSSTVTMFVTNYDVGCGIPYLFDFGMMPSFTVNNQSLIVKFWTTVPPGDVHVYWDSTCCPSALYADCAVPAEGSTWGKIKNLYAD